MSACWPTLHMTVNGQDRAVQAPPMKRLLDVNAVRARCA
jgi:aerobic-type carbon monoxide dehydrogenase small subunit (CoxS/CutS family)